MPRVSREQTEKNREAIEHCSARLFREQGLNGISIADLMGAAGLTHGGFYGHFESKDALAAIACEQAFKQSLQRWNYKISQKSTLHAQLQTITDGYLSNEQRDHPGNGCPAAALAGDVAREAPDKPIRTAYLKGTKLLLNILTRLLPTAITLPETAQQQAMQQLAMLVGAMTLARATAGDPISEQFLSAGRAFNATSANNAV